MESESYTTELLMLVIEHPLINPVLGVYFLSTYGCVPSCTDDLGNTDSLSYVDLPNLDTFCYKLLLISPPVSSLRSCQAHCGRNRFSKLSVCLKTNFFIDNKSYQMFSFKLQAYIFVFKKMSIRYSSLNNQSVSVKISSENGVP